MNTSLAVEDNPIFYIRGPRLALKEDTRSPQKWECGCVSVTSPGSHADFHCKNFQYLGQSGITALNIYYHSTTIRIKNRTKTFIFQIVL